MFLKRKQKHFQIFDFCFLFLFFMPFVSNGQTIKIDSLKKVLAKESDSLKVFDLVADIAWEYSKKNIDLAIAYGEQSVRLAKKFHDKKTIGYAYNALGTFYLYKPNYDKAMLCFQESLKIQEELNDYLNISKLHNNIGNIYLKINLNEKALEEYKLALDFKKKSGKSPPIFPNLLNIGSLYFKMKDYENSKYYYEEACKVVDTVKDKNMLPLLYSNLGLIERQSQNYDKAKNYYLKAEVAGLAIGNVSTDLYSNIASLYQHLGDFKTANAYLYKSYADAIEKKQLDKTLHLYLNLIQNYSYLNNGDSVRRYLVLYTGLRDSVYSSQSLKTLQEISAKFETEKKEQLISLLAKDKAIRDLKIKDQSLQLAAEKIEKEKKNQQIELLNKDKLLKESEIQKERLNLEKSEKENELLNSQKKLSEETIKRQKTFSVLIILALVMSLGLAFFILKNYRQQKLTNKIITEQKLLVEQQKQLVDLKQKEILDSIQYAGRIQKALLAHTDFINKHLPKNFILFKPKDIVSGDFYWATKVTSPEKEDLFYLAVCDSTGHGVPGAFMSLLSIGFLTEAINEKNIFKPNDVFNFVRKRLIESISQEGQKDGFDGILLCINQNNENITYAAANNAPVLVRNNELMTLSYNKMPVGEGVTNHEFELFTIQMEKGDNLYLYTDGYADQFGGPKGKKFMYKQLNQLLLAISEKEMPEQKQILTQHFNDWKGKLEQLDDIAVIGIRHS